MSALLDVRGSIFPRLRRPALNSSTSPVSRPFLGARERLSSPPRKVSSSKMTESSSMESERNAYNRRVPLVQPEATDSDIDENDFEESVEESEESSSSSYARKTRRDGVGERQRKSDCTSPSSASSRDASQVMTTSRSSILELLRVKKKRSTGMASLDKRRASKEESLSLHDEKGDVIGRARRDVLHNRMASRVMISSMTTAAEDSHNTKNNSSFRPISLIPPSTLFTQEILRAHASSRHLSVEAELEETRNRADKITDQLLRRNEEFAQLLQHTKSLERQVESLHQRCILNETIDNLTLQQKLQLRPVRLIEKVEEKLRYMEAEMATAKAEVNKTHEMTLNAANQDRSTFRNSLEQIERLQKENFCLMRGRLIDSDDSLVRRRLAMMPSYDALYSFTMRVVRKLGTMRHTLLERSSELSKTEADLIAMNSSLLVLHASLERLRIQKRDRPLRPSSFHGVELLWRKVHNEMNFFLPFKLHGSWLKNNRKVKRTVPEEVVKDTFENDFISLFGYAKSLARFADVQQKQNSKGSRSSKESKEDPYAVPSHLIRDTNFDISIGQPRLQPIYRPQKRPISLVETEERRCNFTGGRGEPRRRSSVKVYRGGDGGGDEAGSGPSRMVPPHHRYYSGSGRTADGRPAYARVERDTYDNGVRAVCSLQDVSGLRSSQMTRHTAVLAKEASGRRTPPITRRLAPMASVYSHDYRTGEEAHKVGALQREERRMRIERSQPVQGRRPPIHLIRASEGHTHSRQDFSSIGSSTAIQAATDRVTSDGMNEPRTVPNSSNFPEKRDSPTRREKIAQSEKVTNSRLPLRAGVAWLSKLKRRTHLTGTHTRVDT